MRWELQDGSASSSNVLAVTDQDTARRLFTKGLSADAVQVVIQVEGNQALGDVLLGAVAIIA